MQNDLIQKARVGRKNALMSLQYSRDLCFELSSVRRFPELKTNDVAALFDTTQQHFRHHGYTAELQTA